MSPKGSSLTSTIRVGGVACLIILPRGVNPFKEGEQKNSLGFLEYAGRYQKKKASPDVQAANLHVRSTFTVLDCDMVPAQPALFPGL